MIAPSTRHHHLHPDAEAGTYRGATAARVPMIVANGPSMPQEEIASAADGARWIQFYPTPNLVLSRRRLEQFQAAGAQAIVVTVDQQATRFERDLHDRHLGGNPPSERVADDEEDEEAPTSGPELYGLPVPGRLWYNWEYLDQIRTFVNVPMLIKGILTAEDARLCVDRGFDGVVVSNHGARTLDYVPSTLEVLREIVTEVDGAIPVLIDSGFRRGAAVANRSDGAPRRHGERRTHVSGRHRCHRHPDGHPLNRIEMRTGKLTRREALESVFGQQRGEKTPGPSAPPSAPIDELVNSLEFAEQAKLMLSEEDFSSIAGSDRSIFDHYTFRPRMNVSTLDMDLSVDILGSTLFTPIVVGPVSNQKRYHPEGERATIAGASAAKAVTIVSSHTSTSIPEMVALAAEVAMPLWTAVYADEEGPARARAAASAGAQAVFVTVGASYEDTGAKGSTEIDWSLVETIRKSVDVPVVLKGVMSKVDATKAAELGLDGLVVSNFGGLLGGSKSAPLPELLAIRAAVGDELPILVDGSFRRATDILVALILGAQGVLLGRPIMWALASYGAEGVTTILKMLQRDLARCFAMLGASNL